jgi:hypothetical protein
VLATFVNYNYAQRVVVPLWPVGVKYTRRYWITSSDIFKRAKEANFQPPEEFKN